MSSRRIALAVLALVLVAALGYTAYWFHVAGEMRKGVEAWAERQRAEGWQVAWSDLDIRGFPTTIRARIRQPHLVSPAGIAWSAEAVDAEASPFDLTDVGLAAPGRHALRWHEGPELSATAQQATGRLNLSRDGALEDMSIAASGLSAQLPDGSAVTASALALAVDPVPTVRAGHDTPTATITFSVQDLTLPPLPGLLMDPAIARAEVSARVLGAIPGGPALPALQAWSEAGGTVEIDSMILQWAPMAMAAEGTLAFDKNLQPLLALSARVRGYGELMDRLAMGGTIDRSAAEAAKVLLSLLAKPDPEGRPAIPVPVTLQDQTLYLGPAPVARVPAIRWPQE